MRLRLNSHHDPDTLATRYAEHGRVRVFDFLEVAGARDLHGALVSRPDWRQLFIGEDGIVQLDEAARKTLSAADAAALDRQVQERARLGFQYRYEGLRVPHAGERQDEDPLQPFAELMASQAMVSFLSHIVGKRDLRFGEGKATAYGPGDFLTCHDDAVAGRNRVAAFVLGMTPQWRPEWGGLLLFHDADDGRVEGLVPRFNTLDLFAVPQRHSVSYVSPSAAGRRLALTGWLRSGVSAA